MKRLRILLAVAAGGLTFAATPALAVPRAPQLAGVQSFAFAIGSGNLDDSFTTRLAPYDLVVVDGEEATKRQLTALHTQDKVVLAYLSVGTIEPGRSWYRRAKRYRLKDRFEEFGEYYAAPSKRGYRRLIAERVAPQMLRKGFDGLFLDNTDMIEGHRKQARGMRVLVRDLAKLTHGRGELLFTQNGDRSIGPTLRYYDGWNREDVTWTYDFAHRRYRRVSLAGTAAAQATMRKLVARGLLVTSSDYTRKDDTAAASEAVVNSCAGGGLPFVTNIRLTRIPRIAAACP